VSEQHSSPADTPLVPMPALTAGALRAAVAQIAPAHLPAFVEHLDQAVEQASAQSTITPLRSFLTWWGGFVAIHRFPATAARLRELEHAAETATDRDSVRPVLAEIRQIMDDARRGASA
jgi:hypothetical protein